MRKEHNLVPQANRYLVSVSPEGRVRKEGITTAPKLETLQKIVGGPIELVPFFTTYDGTSCVAFCNEYGKLPRYNLPPNRFAHALWEKALGRTITEDYLVGS